MAIPVGHRGGARELGAAPPPVLTVEFRKDRQKLRFFSTITTFGTSVGIAIEELRIECVSPAADDATAELLPGARIAIDPDDGATPWRYIHREFAFILLLMRRVRKRVLLSWSSGKDSAWALHLLRQQSDVEVAGLLTTVSEQFDRVAMHAVRTDLLRRQAESVGLPIQLINLPFPCGNDIYEERMRAVIGAAQSDGIEGIAFGDLFLGDVRHYRERMMEGTGITPLFPLWGRPTAELAREMTAGGLRARITCIDPRCLPATLAGKEYNDDFLKALPAGVDPCGENGEFHSFVFDGPMFNRPVEFTIGETVERDGFIFTDLAPVSS